VAAVRAVRYLTLLMSHRLVSLFVITSALLPISPIFYFPIKNKMYGIYFLKSRYLSAAKKARAIFDNSPAFRPYLQGQV
jgi:hypothetical protein